MTRGGPTRRRKAPSVRVLVTSATVLFPSWAAVSSCSTVGGGTSPDLGVVADALEEPFHPDASCFVTIDSPPLLPAIHVATGTDIQWDSNPPSSGSHYPEWAAYGVAASVVPRGNYVHDLEHGAVVLLYNCGDTGCPDIVAALQAVSDAIPDDPLCVGQGTRVRTLITADPLIDVPVAAAAWGWTYTAACADPPTLTQFALAHYGHGPEVLCGPGIPF